MKCSLLVLSSYLDGELESRRQGELEAHLVGCQRCRAGLGYLREEVERVSSLGRVHVADHSVHSLLATLGLEEPDAELTGARQAAVGLAEAPAEPPSWLDHDAAIPTWPPAHAPEPSIDMTGHGMRPPLPPLPALPVVEPTAPAAEPPPFTWRPAPTEAPASDEGVPAVPFGLDASQPAVPPAPPPSLEPPRGADPPGSAPPWPPPSDLQPDHAPSAPPSGGAFPPGGPEPSDLPEHVTASGGEPEMTASPPCAPHDAAPPPVYPLTDDDVLDTPLPVERFGPPQQVARPSFFERLRDRINTRRALARSSSAYDDSVQIVSGSGAPLRMGRARLEVERRRQEAMRAEADPLAESAAFSPMPDTGDEDDLSGLGPLPPPSTRLSPTPMPRAPVSRPPLPTPPRHTLGWALGDVPLPPRPPMAPASPPAPPRPDPLGQALADFDRDRSSAAEPRPWLPRDVAEDLPPVASPPAIPPSPSRFRSAPAGEVGRHVPAPSQLREGRRLLALFGAATLLMLVVGIVSGRTTSPLPSSTGTTAHNSTPARPAPTHAPKSSAVPTQITLGPGAQAQGPAPTGVQLTGTKVLGDSGTGYQVKDFRYGIHPNDFRIVLDLDAAGATAGTPKATIGFSDPTTLLVALDGVVAAGSTGQLPSSNPVVSVTLLSQSPFPGATTYQIKLAHPVTFGAGYVDTSSTLRLVIDIAG